MPIITLFLIAVVKPLLLWWLVVFIQRNSERESAGLQHQLLLTLLLFSPLLCLSPWLAVVNFTWPVTGDHWLQAKLSGDSGLWLAAGYTAIALTLLFYRLLALAELARRERSYAAAPLHIQAQVAEFRAQLPFAQVDCRLAASPAINAYVWQPPFSRRARLIITTGVLQLPLAEQRIILAHESAHLTRRDWSSQQLAYLVGCLFWPLPFFWRWQSNLAALAERAADDCAVELLGGRQGTELPAQYARLLLHIKQRSSEVPLPVTRAVARHGFYERLNSVLEQLASHEPLLQMERRSAWAITLLWLLPLLLVGIELQAPPLPTPTTITLLAPETEPSPATVPATGPERPSRPHLQPATKPPTARLSWQPLALEQLRVVATRPATVPAPNTQLATPYIEWQGYLAGLTVLPVYPKRAITKGLTGEVSVEFAIDAAGNAFAITILSAKPQGVFEAAVITALQQSHFQPLIINGEAAAVAGITETFRFRLSDAEPDLNQPQTASSQ
ncbi:M56 family metallopeptidase [Halioxenophilus sp. WMMB6]|uniref:M56 family metallopeptidase n=1 Tax=Halioxenophilus sp. WMMB6 TaxID=3073815 RepID=UPI00295EF6D6|nr:M56 family metallopeptidase [Halioxenophilus sp. WMMB6]